MLVVAATAAVTSFGHQHGLALEAGENETAALLLPLSVDGLALAASLVLLDARRSGRPAGALPWLALGLGVIASLAANVAAADPTITGRLVAAWPPVALALSIELLLRQVERGSPPLRTATDSAGDRGVMLDFGPRSNLETTAEQRWTDVGLWTDPGPSSGVQPHNVVGIGGNDRDR